VSTIPTGGMSDACVICPDPPFDRPACPAVAIQWTPGGTLTAHRCAFCDSSWQTWRDVFGWPVERKLDPISPVQAEANRIALALAMEGTWGGAHHAVA
jgi:hypothetical protein